MGRFLVTSYSAISEIALWVFFVAAAVAGFYAGELPGAVLGLVIAFLTSVFLVAPFMMIDDIRKSVVRLEKMKASESISYASSKNVPPTPQPTVRPTAVSGDVKKSGSSVSTGEKIKTYKGKVIIREENGVSVDGVAYENVLAAEKAISNGDKSRWSF